MNHENFDDCLHVIYPWVIKKFDKMKKVCSKCIDVDLDIDTYGELQTKSMTTIMI